MIRIHTKHTKTITSRKGEKNGETDFKFSCNASSI